MRFGAGAAVAAVTVTTTSTWRPQRRRRSSESNARLPSLPVRGLDQLPPRLLVSSSLSALSPPPEGPRVSLRARSLPKEESVGDRSRIPVS